MRREFHTPPQIAERLGVSVGKVIGWLELGELKGPNLAASTKGRPRYRISESDLADFLQRRSASVAPAPAQRRSRTKTNVTSFV